MTKYFIRPVPKVAVCLAAFNGARWLDEQLDSILWQTGVSVTVFVSVDRSSDDTAELVARRAAADARIVALPYGARFGGAARNFFRLLRDVDLSGFGYLALADQDDIWFEDKLSRACQAITAERVDAYSSNVLAFWPDGQEVLVNKSQPQCAWDYLFEAAGPGCTYVFTIRLAQALCRMVRTRWEEVNNVGLHDWLFYAYARANGYKWYIDPQPGLRYRQHSANQVGVNVGWRALRGRLALIGSGWARTQCMQVAVLVGVDVTTPVVRALFDGWTGSLYLAWNAAKVRRSLSGRIALVVICVLNLF